ncbi:MAG: phytanoyl-CoA dioxygenase family protein [Proteobacteria bacterium]|nr:phytanoyl-CoA dioxygenase family protein [Pseudomonadota bacterium]MBI3499188.1 phytanoyl-CoA dioxygenase family protein [Pseudomonadota bacterium]
MQLSDAQLKQFDEEGYVFLANLFRPEEVAILKAEVPALFAERRQENVRERTGDVVRTSFAAHTYNPVYGALARHPRLVGPAMQMLAGPIYIHQFKINGKAAFDGDVWQWHQDYGTWAADDDMPAPRAMNLALFLDEVNEFNGPLMFIPKSHRVGKLPAGHDVTTTSYPLWTIEQATIRRLVAEGGIVAPKGPAGSGLFFHCNLVHGSTSNMSPWDRLIVYISANRTDNAIRRFKRPEHIAHRDFRPILALGDDCLTQFAAKPAAAE